MAIGTDAGGKDQGEIGAFYAEEILRWISWGYEAHAALQAATRVGAEAAGLADRVGTLEPGKWADVIVVEGDVLAAPATVVRPQWVILNGEVVRKPSDSVPDSSTSFAPN
jgi:imidazolonepropionase-like amidohydrolase